MIRTVLGDITPEALGYVLGHEHLIAHPPAIVTDPDLRLENETEAADELTAFHAAGGGTIVEMTTIDYGRDGVSLTRLSRQTRVDIVAATGFNKARFADIISSRHSTEAITAWMIAELTVGLVPPGVRDIEVDTRLPAGAPRAGVIKASSSLNGPTVDERRVFEAAAAAYLATGAAISTHTEKGTWAVEQVELLAASGVPADRILLGHLDLNPDLGYLRAVAATGAYLGLDQFGKAKYLPDQNRLDLVEALARDGFLDRLILSGDMARRSSWIAGGGGPGLAHIPRYVRARLVERGFSDAAVRRVLGGNAAAWLPFQPKPPPHARLPTKSVPLGCDEDVP
jgi:phosphotriesterase-related protein